MKSAQLSVSLNTTNQARIANTSEVVFQCSFDQLADQDVQYTVKYFGDNKEISSHQTTGDVVQPLREIELDEISYGSQVRFRDFN